MREKCGNQSPRSLRSHPSLTRGVNLVKKQKIQNCFGVEVGFEHFGGFDELIDLQKVLGTGDFDLVF